MPFPVVETSYFQGISAWVFFSFWCTVFAVIVAEKSWAMHS